MSFPGDDVIPDAAMVFDRLAAFDAPPETVWPWLVQLGKGRAGWYLPSRLERAVIPRKRRAATTIEPRWQDLEAGDRVPDYGPDGWFEVHAVEPPHTLVYVTGTRFSWALLLDEPRPGTTHVHLRFRARLQSTGLKRTLIRFGGGLVDRWTTELLFAGLRERVR